MTLRNDPFRYGFVAQALHWLTAILVLAAYLLSEGGPEARVYSAAADGARRIHETLGILVFGVVLLRISWRVIDQTPARQPMPAWMALSGKLVHLLLYALLVAIPGTAILGTWYEGHPLTFNGLDIAPAVGSAHELGQLFIEVHTTLGNVILWVAGLHAAAALFHHFYLRDGVLKSMAPWRG